jgi:hypothetical protein
MVQGWEGDLRVEAVVHHSVWLSTRSCIHQQIVTEHLLSAGQNFPSLEELTGHLP